MLHTFLLNRLHFFVVISGFFFGLARLRCGKDSSCYFFISELLLADDFLLSNGLIGARVLDWPALATPDYVRMNDVAAIWIILYEDRFFSLPFWDHSHGDVSSLSRTGLTFRALSWLVVPVQDKECP